jgi:hypothetical protein
VSEHQPPPEPVTSGSRWEDPDANPEAQEIRAASAETPADQESALAHTPAAAAGEASAPAASAVAEPPHARQRFGWLRGRGALAGAGLALVLVAGLGGFAVGYAASDGLEGEFGDGRVDHAGHGWGDERAEDRPGDNPGDRGFSGDSDR